MQGFHIFPGGRRKAILRHAPTGLALADLEGGERGRAERVGEGRRDGAQNEPRWDSCLYPEGRTPALAALLATMGSVDPVPLNQLVGGGVGPEVVRCLQLGVLQGTRADWEERESEGGGVRACQTGTLQ